ncbi:hypothetical protein [Microbacterium phyllosphaerae]|uniref:hypothetical protein n=1 Tax=Microbacterium phyllosphaerae TaxID=124798 RepID=UPI000EA1D0FD|nr:hypothetical protein [Microbacterium phyllosphaerae]
MSYDLDVYGKVSLTTRELVKVVTADWGLKAQVDRGSNTLLSVDHKRPRRMAFGLDGPMQIDAEDLPEGVPQVAGATVLYSIHVSYDVQTGPEGFSATADDTSVTAAVAFASRLAERIGGTVVDPQQEVARPVAEAQVVESPPETWMHFAWFRLKDGSVDFARDYLESARHRFPLAVPVRFGTYEPMQGRLPRDPDEAFFEVFAQECGVSSLMFVNGQKVSGSISGWSRDIRMRYHSVRVSIRLDAIEKAGLLSAVEDFLIDVATRSRSFFAFVELNHSWLATADFPHFEGGWSGLPARAQWLTWFGTEYAPLVRPHLSVSNVTEHKGGLSHRWVDAPTLNSEWGAPMVGGTWIDPRFVPTVQGSDVLAPAVTVPSQLRAPEPGSPEAQRLETLFAANRAKSRPV